MIEVSMQVQEVLSRRGLLVEELDQVFAELDTDGNHELDWGEFKDALEMLGVNLDVERARLLFTMFDEDESGTVAFSEFTAQVQRPTVPPATILASDPTVGCCVTISPGCVPRQLCRHAPASPPSR